MILQKFHEQFNGYKEGSLAYKFRTERMRIFENFFEKMFADYNRTVNILDGGGTPGFWIDYNFKYLDKSKISVINLSERDLRIGEGVANVYKGVGDVTNLKEYDDKSFDLVFSNSVIEHVGGIDAQKKLVSEMRRVGKHYYLQTPNFWFPMEPHFHFIGFQWMPIWLRTIILQYSELKRKGIRITREDARERVSSVRLLSYSKLRRLFPEAKIHKEKFLIFTKSFYLFV